jgi:hypothetical protein
VAKFAKPGAEMKWMAMDAENNNYWSLPLSNEIKLGEKGASIISNKVIIDSGLSYAMIPTTDVNTISQLI